jgi:hypothetical protein
MTIRQNLAVTIVFVVSTGSTLMSFAQEPEQQPQQKRERQKGAQTTTLTGCLTKGATAEQYVLTDDGGMKTPVTASAAVGLEKHVNHTVKLTGTLNSADKTFTATKVEHIAASCLAPK